MNILPIIIKTLNKEVKGFREMRENSMILRLGSYWSSYKKRIYGNCTDPTSLNKSLEYWRNNIFAISIVYFMPLCLIALIPALYMAVIENAVLLFISDMILVVSLLTIAFVPGISVYTRKIIFCLALFQISFYLLFYLGTFGPGMMYLFAITVFMVLIFDKKYAYGSVVLNTLVCIGFAVAIHFNWWSSEIFTVYDLKNWIGVSSNLIFLSFLAVLLIPKLFDGLEETIQEQYRLGKELEKNQEKLEKSLLVVEDKNKELNAHVNEKEVLLIEIHHRVKNNLAIISGLLQIQAFDVEDEEVERKLVDSMFRIRTMASVHELLYESKNFSHVNISSMLEKLSSDICNTMKGGKEIEIQMVEEPVQLNINQAIPCALIINEVLTNVFKHAFVKRESGEIQMSVKSEGDNVKIVVQDNGVGLEENKKGNSSLGMHLLEILSQQLNGENHYFGDETGTRFTIEFTKSEAEGAASSLAL